MKILTQCAIRKWIRQKSCNNRGIFGENIRALMFAVSVGGLQ